MQTFLPYKEFTLCARVLDWRRLGKQRAECKQILNALERGGGWSNHPAVKMWQGYEDALKLYTNTIIVEWERRGYNNNMPLYEHDVPEMPWWLGSYRLHSSHRSNLLRKDPEWYGKFPWKETPDLEYFWPGGKSESQKRFKALT